MPANRYRLYVDESGDHSFRLLDQPGRRYLGLLGVWFRQQGDYVRFADDLERFKREVFGPHPDAPVILHRTEVINRRGPFGALCRPEIRERFNAGLLDIIRAATFRVVCVILDKRRHMQESKQPLDPYQSCLAALVMRYARWLDARDACGDVMAESRGRKEDLQLNRAYRDLYEEVERLPRQVGLATVLTSRNVKFRGKDSNIPGLQLADVLAHPVKQACLIERGCMQARQDTFGMRLFQVVEEKMDIGQTPQGDSKEGVVWL